MPEASQWYVAVGGQQQGPFSTEEIRSRLASRTLTPDALVYAHGATAEWTPAGQIPALAEGPTAPPPPVPAPGGGMRAHEVDYQVGGDDLQYVVVELDPQETVVAEAGAMMYMEDGIEMETRFGDGSKPDKGFFGKLVEGAKRKMTGETLFLTHYTHQGQGKSHVAFGAPYPGKIIPVDLREIGGTLLCQKDAFLCCAKGIELGIAFQKRLGVGFFGGEGFIMQKLTGDGMAFMHAGGTVIEKDLEAGQQLRIDTGCIVGYQEGVDFEIKYVGGVKTALFGGEGLFFAKLTGPGRIWMQTLPFSRLADRVYSAAPQTGGSRKGEGSVLGGLGDLFDGDN
jgi:uncharacterized protein (TIGR00266 family)